MKLKSILSEKTPIQFTLVHEPPQFAATADAGETECVDIGVAELDLSLHLNVGQDGSTEQTILVPIVDVENRAIRIGSLMVSIAIPALN